jgi:peptide/nickel transport system permease protein
MTATTLKRIPRPRIRSHLVRYVLRRRALGLLTLGLVTIVVFAITNILPGNPAEVRLGPLASPEALAAEEKRMGLDKPLPERYWTFVSGAVQGDFGTSFKT